MASGSHFIPTYYHIFTPKLVKAKDVLLFKCKYECSGGNLPSSCESEVF